MVSRKLLTINIVVVLLLIAVHTLGGYLLIYPGKSDVRTIISESRPQYLLIALAIFALIAG